MPTFCPLNMLKLIQPMPEVSKSSITRRAYIGGCIPSIGEAKVTLVFIRTLLLRAPCK